jgi:type IV secretory pathway VirB10-like protein
MTTEDAVASNPPPSKGVDPTPSPRYTRVCTVCGKQPALPDASDSAVGSESLDPEKPLKLRQIKTLQRQSATKTSRKMQNSDRNAAESEDGSNGSDDDEECESDNEDMNAEESDEDKRKPAWTVAAAATNDSDGVEDPFLAAIGGVQNLLVGEAYQTKRLLEKTK